MYLLVGLGNPGERYELTYHNMGFIIIDAICKFWNFDPFYQEIGYLISSGRINKNKIVLLKPYSFMNNSGISVAKVQNLYKFSLDNIIVIHDDADLKLGKVKMKRGGSSAGHKGLRSIDSFISSGYWRLRFGIGRPNDQRNLSDYVLSKFTNFSSFADSIKKISENIHLVLQGNGFHWDFE
ncbi:MAG: aminoacyl-tRNA hydrolase [Wolbachia endosymbiont of Menacanthus eurysternus]|nr:MAG: aminoacyl-tRNA hydrolase [Wolbachia endosymbiont of Menacanthus eurysternus]